MIGPNVLFDADEGIMRMIDLKPGMQVKTQGGFRKILHVFQDLKRDIAPVRWRSNRLTPDHLILFGTKWAKAGDLASIGIASRVIMPEDSHWFGDMILVDPSPVLTTGGYIATHQCDCGIKTYTLDELRGITDE